MIFVLLIRKCEYLCIKWWRVGRLWYGIEILGVRDARTPVCEPNSAPIYLYGVRELILMTG